MLKEEIKVGEKYQIKVFGQVVTGTVIRKYRFCALVTYGSRWDYTEPSYTVYKKVFYGRFLEEW